MLSLSQTREGNTLTLESITKAWGLGSARGEDLVWHVQGSELSLQLSKTRNTKADAKIKIAMVITLTNFMIFIKKDRK